MLKECDDIEKKSEILTKNKYEIKNMFNVHKKQQNAK